MILAGGAFSRLHQVGRVIGLLGFGTRLAKDRQGCGGPNWPPPSKPRRLEPGNRILGPPGIPPPKSVFGKRGTGLVLVLVVVIEKARKAEDEHEDDDG